MRYLEIWTINISATFGNIGHKNSYSVWDLFTQPWWLTPTLGWWRRSKETARRTDADCHGLIVMDNTLLHCTIDYSFVQFITVLHYNYAILYCIILYYTFLNSTVFIQTSEINCIPANPPSYSSMIFALLLKSYLNWK